MQDPSYPHKLEVAIWKRLNGKDRESPVRGAWAALEDLAAEVLRLEIPLDLAQEKFIACLRRIEIRMLDIGPEPDPDDDSNPSRDHGSEPRSDDDSEPPTTERHA